MMLLILLCILNNNVDVKRGSVQFSFKSRFTTCVNSTSVYVNFRFVVKLQEREMSR